MASEAHQASSTQNIFCRNWIEFSLISSCVERTICLDLWVHSQAREIDAWEQYCQWSTGVRLLRSSSTLCLNPVGFNLKTYGSRAFSVSAPELWNKLPDDICSWENLSLFKHKLKTYLFKNFYFSHYKDVFDFISVLFKFKFMYFN